MYVYVCVCGRDALFFFFNLALVSILYQEASLPRSSIRKMDDCVRTLTAFLFLYCSLSKSARGTRSFSDFAGCIDGAGLFDVCVCH